MMKTQAKKLGVFKLKAAQQWGVRYRDEDGDLKEQIFPSRDEAKAYWEKHEPPGRFSTFKKRIHHFRQSHRLKWDEVAEILFQKTERNTADDNDSAKPTRKPKHDAKVTSQDLTRLKRWRLGENEPTSGVTAMKKRLFHWLQREAILPESRARDETLWLFDGGPDSRWREGKMIRVASGKGFKDVFVEDKLFGDVSTRREVPYYEGRES